MVFRSDYYLNLNHDVTSTTNLFSICIYGWWRQKAEKGKRQQTTIYMRNQNPKKSPSLATIFIQYAINTNLFYRTHHIHMAIYVRIYKYIEREREKKEENSVVVGWTMAVSNIDFTMIVMRYSLLLSSVRWWSLTDSLLYNGRHLNV